MEGRGASPGDGRGHTWERGSRFKGLGDWGGGGDSRVVGAWGGAELLGRGGRADFGGMLMRGAGGEVTGGDPRAFGEQSFWGRGGAP